MGVAASVFTVLWLPHLDAIHDPEALIRDYAEPRHLPLALVHRDLAIHRATSLGHNRRTIERVTLLHRAAVCLLAVEVVAWVVDYALTI